MKKIVPAMMALIVLCLMISCPHEADDDDPYSGLKKRKFYAYDFSQKNYYQVDAVRLAVGGKCVVWAEKSSGVSVDTGKAIAREYDNAIYSKIVGAFGSDSIMQNGDVDGDGKFTLLLLDIKDGYNGSGAYTAGYFGSSDLYSGTNSNGADMIYLDTYPAKPGSPGSYATIAHELQHFINLINGSQYRLHGNYIYAMDTWIDEGLSLAAEYVYLGGHDMSRINWFTTDSTTIPQGNNFFVWGENQSAILDEYSTAYLFFQWLRLQSGGTGIYRDIIISPYPYYDYQAVTRAITGPFAAELSSVPGSTTWEKLLGAWFAANYINSSTGIYGYKGDLPTVRVWAIGGQANKPLLPGEGVYSVVPASPGTFPSGGGPHIKYAGLRKTSPYVSASTLYANERLLTFNAFGDLEQYAVANGITTFDDLVAALPETGNLTGEAAEPRPSIMGNGRQASRRPGSWAIDARDLLGRRGREEALPIKLWSPDNGAE